ncbi:hypothetical protein H6G97_12475 [Nostoc flagelliforme FACHB-838]|uniref:Transposase n=1 Tax=Nostoc flagelliforme FACHB-838 TaxID=2692904 RepID=A0ABR8DM61_9NOSO|nr:hypothetical protein [Nostoc flagelliforme]MBD2530344.1 hypothetical protein [Nostoc flagelliforme FACHB-838]
MQVNDIQSLALESLILLVVTHIDEPDADSRPSWSILTFSTAFLKTYFRRKSFPVALGKIKENFDSEGHYLWLCEPMQQGINANYIKFKIAILNCIVETQFTNYYLNQQQWF